MSSLLVFAICARTLDDMMQNAIASEQPVASERIVPGEHKKKMPFLFRRIVDSDNSLPPS
jgi:hypothetical protein